MAVRRTFFVWLLLALGLPAFAFFRVQRTDTGDVVQRLATLQLYEVRRGDVELSVSAIGTLEANASTRLSFLVAGRVAEVLFERDDYVLANDPLIRLDNTLQRIAYEQAVLALEKAELAMQDLLEVDESQVRLAQAALDSAWGALNSINNAVSANDIEAARLNYEQALKRAEDLGNRFSSAPPDQYELLRVQSAEAQAQADIARLQLESLQNRTAPQAGAAYARVLQAQQEVERVKAGPTQVQIDAAQAQITRAENELERARLAYERTTLYAPFDGVLSALNVEVGSLVAPSLTVAELVDISPLSLKVQVDEVDIGILREGLPVRVTLDALADVTLSARLVKIAPSGASAGGVVTYPVDIELASDDPRARVGMTAEATIVVQARQNALFVPNLYLRIDRRTGEAFVNVLRDDNTLEEVQVTLGLQGQETSEVLSGLSEGDLIAIDLGGRGIQSFFGG